MVTLAVFGEPGVDKISKVALHCQEMNCTNEQTKMLYDRIVDSYCVCDLRDTIATRLADVVHPYGLHFENTLDFSFVCKA